MLWLSLRQSKSNAELALDGAASSFQLIMVEMNTTQYGRVGSVALNVRFKQVGQ